MKNIFFFRHINQIGGIETYFYYLAKKYQDWDITIYYMTGDIKQIRRLQQYVRVKQYKKGEKIVCDKAFFNFNLDIIDNVEAKEYIQIAHGDYKAMGIKPSTHLKITKYLGVSKQVCDTFKEVTGYDTSLAYNPIEIDKPRKVLNLISATRLTKEKGKNRMIKLAEMLDKANIPYLWIIFTNDTDVINNPNIIYMKPRLDIINYIANADYLVQLSDNEGYCYSVVEALSVGTPVIVTDVPVLKEIGVVNGKNGWVIDFDLNNVPIDNIYNKELKFEYTPKEDNWCDILEKGESTYKEEKEMKAKVKALFNFNDMEDNKRRVKDEEWVCSLERAEYLVDHKAVEILEEIKEELKEPVVDHIENIEKAMERIQESAEEEVELNQFGNPVGTREIKPKKKKTSKK